MIRSSVRAHQGIAVREQSAMASECPWLARLVVACQEMAWHVLLDNRAALGRRLRDLERLVPADIRVQHRLVVRTVVGRVVAQTARLTGLAGRTEVASALIEWVASDTYAAEWRRDIQQLTELCATALEAGGLLECPAANDPRIEVALAAIRERYQDTRLTLVAVARASELSPCYLAHMMKRQTGLTFGAHLHRARLAAARDVLECTALSIKEVASLVGYGSSSQLGRHFKRAFGTTPFAYRHAARTTDKNRRSIERIGDESALKRFA